MTERRTHLVCSSSTRVASDEPGEPDEEDVDDPVHATDAAAKEGEEDVEDQRSRHASSSASPPAERFDQTIHPATKPVPK